MKKIYLIAFLTFNSLLLGTNNDAEITYDNILEIFTSMFECDITTNTFDFIFRLKFKSEKGDTEDFTMKVKEEYNTKDFKTTTLAPALAFQAKSIIDTYCNDALKQMESSGPILNSESRNNCQKILDDLEFFTAMTKYFEVSNEKRKEKNKIKEKIEYYKKNLKMD